LRRRARDSHTNAYADAKSNANLDTIAHLDPNGHADRDRNAEIAPVEGASAAVATG
jgi:hypothetical protein